MIYRNLKDQASKSENPVSVEMDESRKEEIASRLVQEIAQKGEEIPEKYILKNEVILPAIDASPTLWSQSLIIDFSLLSIYDPSSTAVQNQLTKLHSALKHWGCFQVFIFIFLSLFTYWC